MRSAFNLFRKWFTSKPREAVPPWHVSVHIVGSVREDSGEILGPSVALSAGNFAFQVPDHCRVLPSEGTVAVRLPEHTKIDLHTEVHNYE
ncbi:MAG: hypothetical protein Q4A17_03455 [Thermoguttaceae bacterium]|nr:hypothetical protein [Thermoguttaceae bacterium]